MPFKLASTVSSRAASPPVYTKASVSCPASKPKQQVRSAESITHHQSHIKNTEVTKGGCVYRKMKVEQNNSQLFIIPDRQKKVCRLVKAVIRKVFREEKVSGFKVYEFRSEEVQCMSTTVHCKAFKC